MPKRRVTGKQRAASRRNLVKARAARKRVRRKDGAIVIPHGKTRLLYHQTTPKAAAGIAKHGFRVRGYDGRFTPGTVHFSNRRSRNTSHIGSTTLAIKVPRKAVIGRHTRRFTSGEEWVEIDQKSLRGRRPKRA